MFIMQEKLAKILEKIAKKNCLSEDKQFVF